ncbi:MAG: DHH family phosphoesterase [bacterium]
MIYTDTQLSLFREEFWNYIEQGDTIVITAHISPDDDSIGSVLATYTILTAKYPQKNISIIYTAEKLEKYTIFHNFDKIVFVSDISEHLAGVDTLITLDVCGFARVSKNPEVLRSVPVRLCIDHHGSMPDDFTCGLIVPAYSSNSELVYTALEGEKYLDKNLAEIVMLGILGDTGNLTHIDAGQTQVFSIVKKLVEVGDIRIDSFLSRYRTIPKNIVPLLQEFVKNTTYANIENWPSLQYSFVNRDFMEKNNFSDEDMSAASHIYMGQYLPRIENQQWGFVFSPRNDGGVRMSSRSLSGSVNVRVFSEALGIGGGHDRASGANFKPENDEKIQVAPCIEKVLEFMKTTTPTIG